MKIIKKILIGLFVLIFLLVIGFMIVLNMYGTGSTTGGGTLHQPYYITPKPMVIKNVPLPKGTKLIYEFIYPKHTELDKPLEKRYIESIVLPEGQYINWGGFL